jgi:hypothetical protein
MHDFMSSLLFSLVLTAGLVYSLPDSHGHHHSAPLLELNETEVLRYHAPTPPSYWSIDLEHVDPSISTHPNLILFHVLFSSLAFFLALPIGLSLSLSILSFIASINTYPLFSYRIAFPSSPSAHSGYFNLLFFICLWLGCGSSVLEAHA